MPALTHEFSCKLSVGADRAFAALSEPAELKAWFAEHVDVEPREGGAFRFWGRHTYGAPTKAEADQKFTRFDAPAALAFTWTVHDQPSEVSLRIEPDPEDAAGVVVKGVHVFAQLPAIARAKEMVDDLWRLQCGNLQAHVRGGGVLLPDYSDAKPEIRLSIDIDAPRETVFRALTVPALLNQWVAAAAEVEPRIGGRYAYGWKYDMGGKSVEGGPSRIIDIVENEKLVTDWPDWRGDETVPRQTLTWLLEARGPEQTRVTIIHGGFVRAVDISDYPFGWGFFTSRLKAVAEGRETEAALEHAAG